MMEDRGRHERRHRDDDHDDHRRRRHRRHRAVPVHNLTVDCTPVTFQTPGQVRTVLSCPVSQLSVCTTTEVVDAQFPLANGCVVTLPVAQTVQTPAICTFNVPPTLVPIPVITCPTICAPCVSPCIPCGCGGN